MKVCQVKIQFSIEYVFQSLSQIKSVASPLDLHRISYAFKNTFIHAESNTKFILKHLSQWVWENHTVLEEKSKPITQVKSV